MLKSVADRGPLPLNQKFGYAFGDYGINLYWQSITLFLLFYYTEVAGLSPATAGFVYMIASIFDGVIDPVMGVIADRTRSRWGRYRPYLLLGAVPLGLAFCALYYRPAVQGFSLLAFVLTTHLVFRVCLTIVAIPYSAMTARITSRSSERSTVAGLRMMFATLAGMTVSWTTQPMVAALGRGDSAKGFFLVASISALVATLTFLIVFAMTREPGFEDHSVTPLSWRECWRSVKHNRAFWIVMIGIGAGAMSATILGKSLLYYFKYFLHDEAGARYALSLNAALGLAIIPAWMLYTRRVGKRGAWLTAAGWGLVGLAGFAIFGAATPARATAFFLFMHASSLGISLTFWSMLPDTVEYGEWRTHLRAESFVFGLAQFFVKAALGLGAGLFGLALGEIGFRANAVQTPATLHSLTLLIAVLPALGLIGSALAMLIYPMRPGVHESIVKQLAARRAGQPLESQVPAD